MAISEEEYARLYPNGRTFYYEGDDPVQFLKEMNIIAGVTTDGLVLATVQVQIADPRLALAVQNRYPVGT